jgi:tetratricopeptide (TPR) repeat protein
MRIHPKAPLLARLAADLPAESRQYLAHVAACPSCRERLAALLEREPAGAAEGLGGMSGVLHWPELPGVDRLLAGSTRQLVDLRATFARGEVEATELLSELLAESPAGRARLLDEEPRLWTWPLAELLVETVRETSFLDPTGAERLAGLALGLAGRLPAPPYPGRRGDLLARIWAGLGNARRLSSDLAGAERAFVAAHACLRQGSRDALERAHVADLEASLAADQRRFGEALRLLSRATAVFREYGELHQAGRSVVKMATVESRAGEPERAIPLLQEALTLIEPGREPRLDLSIRHNLATALADAGRALEARRLFAESRDLYPPEPWLQNRRRWLSGKIARGLGQLAEAEAAFLAARDGFLAEGIPYDTALVTLELAALYAEAGRTAELRRLAAETVPIFRSRRIHREALIALSFFRRQTIETEAATTEVIARVASYLRRAENDPSLRFEMG